MIEIHGLPLSTVDRLIQQMTEEEIMEYAGIKVNSSDLV
jgi:hypothetical protein